MFVIALSGIFRNKLGYLAENIMQEMSVAKGYCISGTYRVNLFQLISKFELELQSSRCVDKLLKLVNDHEEIDEKEDLSVFNTAKK